MLPGVLGFEHLVDPFSIGLVANVARWQGVVLIVANPESSRESRFSLSVCGRDVILVELNAEWESWAGKFIPVGYWGGSAVS